MCSGVRMWVLYGGCPCAEACQKNGFRMSACLGGCFNVLKRALLKCGDGPFFLRRALQCVEAHDLQQEVPSQDATKRGGNNIKGSLA